MKNILIKLILVGTIFTAVVAAKTYSVDETHSSVGFVAKHLLISDVDGVFEDYQITLDMAKQNIRKFNVDVNVSSVDTRNEKRDQHLQSGDFFEESKYPKITFRSKGYKRISATEGMIFGDLVIKDVSKRVILNVKLSKPTTFQGEEIMAISIDGKVKRKDFKVGSNFPSAVVGDEIKLRINLEVKS